MPTKYAYRKGKYHPLGRAAYKTAKLSLDEVNMGSNFTAEEVEFMLAMDRYKKRNRRPFPRWHEVLAVLLALGYRKVVG